jgi:hypothetical protein
MARPPASPIDLARAVRIILSSMRSSIERPHYALLRRAGNSPIKSAILGIEAVRISIPRNELSRDDLVRILIELRALLKEPIFKSLLVPYASRHRFLTTLDFPLILSCSDRNRSKKWLYG